MLVLGTHNLRSGSKRQRIHDAVLAMARGVSARTGEEFFERLVLSAVEALGADSGYIVRLNGSATRARTLCAVVSGKPMADFEYSVAGTPCEQLVKSGTRVFPDKVTAPYANAPYLAKRNLVAYVGAKLKDASGKLLGLMFVLFNEPRPQQDFVSSALGFFAGRAAGELERQKSDALVRGQAALLDKAQDVILVHDFKCRVGFWNSSAIRLYGWSADELIGCLANQLIYQNQAALASAMETTIAKGEWMG